jgi:hypothetical protein
MKPRLRAAPGSSTSHTVTALMLALETSSNSPSAEIASEFGVLPGGASGVSVATSVSPTLPASMSMTDTLLRLALATNRRLPSGDITISLGCSSTSIRSMTRHARVSITATAAWAQRET